MQDFFREHFHARMPLEQLETAISTIALMEDVGFTAPFEPLQEVVEMFTVQPVTDGYVAQAMFVLDDGLNLLLQAHGVELTATTPIAYKVSLGRTLIELDTYYLPSDVLAIIDSTFDPEAVVAEIVYLTQGILPEESLEYIQSVSDALITMIDTVMRTKFRYQDATSNTDLLKLDRERVIKLNTLLKGPHSDSFTYVRELIQSGVKSAHSSAADLINQYAEPLSLMAPEQRTRELLGLVLFSDTPIVDCISTTQTFSSEFTDLLADQRIIERVLMDHRILLQPTG